MVRLFNFMVNKPVSRRLRGHQEESDHGGKYMSVKGKGLDDFLTVYHEFTIY